jgi:hypothetical protein
MGIGDRFRFGLMPKGVWSVGVAVGRMPWTKHKSSIHVELLFWRLYIGIGRSYEEFER